MKYKKSYESPLGIICIFQDEEGICALGFGKGEQDAVDAVQQDTELLNTAVQQLEEYFAGSRKQFDVPLSMHGTAFQKRVWDCLLQIPYGETRSYGEIAAMVGNPKACRAVGMANNRNPVAIIVPCHRVIGADGSLTGYGGGLSIKEKLLKLEQGIRI